LSKRDGDRLGFPVFAMNWTDPRTGEPATGFRETGFLPTAFVNLLAMLGWNDGTNQELFTLEELIQRFSLDRVHKGGAKFDFEKAKWFNHEWIKKLPVTAYSEQVRTLFELAGIPIPETDLLCPLTDQGTPANPSAPSTTGISDAPPLILPSFLDAAGESIPELMYPAYGLSREPIPAPNRFEKILELVKERCTFLPDFLTQASFFFRAPADDKIDLASIKPKWNDAKQTFFTNLLLQLQLATTWEAHPLETQFKEMAAAAAIKPGDLLAPLRIMLVGGKFGPGVFDIAALLGKEETISRIRHTLGLLQATS
jgi:glutamyl-tRNA synthetase